MNTNSTASLPALKSGKLKAYFELLKPRVMYLVIFTALVGMVIAPQGIPAWQSMIALFAIAIGAGGSGALNMWYDRDIDRLMKRTQKRPLCTNAVTSKEALMLGLGFSGVSIILLYQVSNILSTFLLFFTIFFYISIYTVILKRKTPQNIVIGGAAGAFPPMIGYSVQTGMVSFESIILFLIIFFWTPPHFWMLSLDRFEDYANAKVPMLPNTHGEKETLRQSLFYVIILWPVTFLPFICGYWSKFYGISMISLNIMFTYNLLKYGKTKPKKVFGISIIYLFLLFMSILIDAWIRKMI